MDKKCERMEEFIDIDINIANQLYKCYDPKNKVSEIHLFKGGRSTTNYKIKVNDEFFVLRIYPNDDKRCLKEKKIADKFKNAIPVPQVYYINNKKELLNKDFAIMEFVEGITLDQYIAEGNEVSDKIFEQLGHILAYIHKDKYKLEGFLDENLQLVDGLPPILEWYHYFLSQKAGERIGEDMKKQIYEIINEKYEQLKKVFFSSVLCHGDFRTNNIMVKDNKVTGIIDWEFTLAAPLYFDIGQLFRFDEQVTKSNEISFINAYNLSSDTVLHKDWKKLGKIIDMANFLCFLNNKDENKENLYEDMNKLLSKTVNMLQEDL
ncbi:aminoglycoside phosphotransferase family protein [Vallitalea sp.]|uniref:aminoglycoside phosphotransferase family protein n=1 Tax=Vallitalea sp. TaxID=1882829 RepID=UPI0025DEDFD2|nr:aminoglycoside phosphotransferase family protein [Vallitalea sp.]MCT4686735.1 aminoglycoside phosphotransferase family protein [Vallitalea sp.]